MRDSIPWAVVIDCELVDLRPNMFIRFNASSYAVYPVREISRDYSASIANDISGLVTELLR
jgi:hypothetical protein